jgi:ActR/RegA family two-component response regulator
MTAGHILIIDDDRDFVGIYRDLLQDLGLEVSVAHSTADAEVILDKLGFELDVILLDQKLQGSGGPDSGFDLLARLQTQVPLAKTIVVTGYMRPDAIEQAFRLGAYDYIVKNGGFEAMLRAKVKNAIEVTQARRLVVADRASLRAHWISTLAAKDPNRKGRMLEELVKLLFRATPGFEQVDTRLDNGIEEIDIMIANRSKDPIWANDGIYILGECKHWSKRCGSPELGNFLRKLDNKYKRVRTGIFIAPGGFTDEFKDARGERKLAEYLVVTIDNGDIERWIDADDRVAVLNELHKRSVFE